MEEGCSYLVDRSLQQRDQHWRRNRLGRRCHSPDPGRIPALPRSHLQSMNLRKTQEKHTVALVSAVATAISSSAVSTSTALLTAISASSTVTHLLTVLRFSVKPE
jgi:hypothetical protein